MSSVPTSVETIEGFREQPKEGRIVAPPVRQTPRYALGNSYPGGFDFHFPPHSPLLSKYTTKNRMYTE